MPVACATRHATRDSSNPRTCARCYCPHSSTSRRRMVTPMEARDDVSGGPGGGEIPPPLQSPLAGSHPDRWPAGGQATHRHRHRRVHARPKWPRLAAKQRIDTVIDERTRQLSLFDAPPELELVPAPSPITQHPSPAPMSQIADVLSPSQVRTFMDCSARWWYKYGLGLPDPKGSSLVRGIVVHRMAEIYLRTKFAGAAPEVDELAEIFENVWNETSAEGSFQPGEDLDKLKAQTAALARMYLDEVAPEIEPAVIRGEPAIEMRVAGEIAGVKV